jgi:hypothetical protein
MKQTNLMRWIEVAEARSVWLLAEESLVPATRAMSVVETQPVHALLARLREQLCLGEAARRLVRAYRAGLAGAD